MVTELARFVALHSLELLGRLLLPRRSRGILVVTILSESVNIGNDGTTSAGMAGAPFDDNDNASVADEASVDDEDAVLIFDFTSYG